MREASGKAHASITIKDRLDEAVQARWRKPLEPFKPDDIIMVWRVPVPCKGGKWVGPGVVIQTHHSIVWTSMHGSLWKCTNIQCKLAADDESRGLEFRTLYCLILELSSMINADERHMWMSQEKDLLKQQTQQLPLRLQTLQQLHSTRKFKSSERPRWI